MRIRFTRTGRCNRPSYRLVVQDIRTRRDGPAIEILGWYDPARKENAFQFDLERARHWMALGAKPSERAAGLLKKAGLESL